MGAVELDRQGIERRDFPIVRRGYDPASVDAHLRALAAEVEDLRHEAGSSRGHASLAASAGTQVQGILEAAQSTAETIERQAAQDAQRARDAANADARRTREEAVAHAREHVAGVSKATESLLERVGSMDGETRALVDSLHTGASRLASDLAAVETNMEALYDAASGRSGGGEAMGEPAGSYSGADHAPVAAPAAEPHDEPFVEMLSESHAGMHGDPYTEVPLESQTTGPWPQPEFESLISEEDDGEPAPAGGDLDGARLVALNMALNGDSREETGQYLAENFDVPDSDRLLDEVYAAIEG
ncbi:MAG: DivIVA domain-containing protein [Solirubrobacteraceae bacterium]